MYTGPWSGGDTYRNPGPVAYPGWKDAPVPGWGMQPNMAGPRMLAVGLTMDDDADTWRTHALLVIGGIALAGGVVGYLVGRSRR